MSEIPKTLLLLLFERDLEEYLAVAAVLSSLHITLKNLRNSKTRTRLEKAVTTWLYRRN